MCKLSGYLATALWAAALLAMLAGTIDHSWAGLAWGLFLSQVALGFTTWKLSERRDSMRERSVEQITEVVDALHEARRARRHLR